MENETFELTGKDARDYFENDPENQDQLGKGDRVIVELYHEKKAATWMVVPEDENPSNYVSEEDDYNGVVAWLVEHDFTSDGLTAARKAQLGL
jgi:hypothetical protein